MSQDARCSHPRAVSRGEGERYCPDCRDLWDDVDGMTAAGQAVKTLCDAITGSDGKVTRVTLGGDAVRQAWANCDGTYGPHDHPCRKALGHFGPCGDAHVRNPDPRPQTWDDARPGYSAAPDPQPRHCQTTESPFERIAREIGALVAEKNRAYGDSFARSGEIMRVLYPNGIRPDQYDDALGVIRVIDKLFRIATDRDALGESPWRDVAGYGVLGAARSDAPT